MTNPEKNPRQRKIKDVIAAGAIGLAGACTLAAGVSGVVYGIGDLVNNKHEAHIKYPLASDESAESAKEEIVVFEQRVMDSLILDDNTTSGDILSPEEQEQYYRDIKIVEDTKNYNQALSLFGNNANRLGRDFVGGVVGGIVGSVVGTAAVIKAGTDVLYWRNKFSQKPTNKEG